MSPRGSVTGGLYRVTINLLVLDDRDSTRATTVIAPPGVGATKAIGPAGDLASIRPRAASTTYGTLPATSLSSTKKSVSSVALPTSDWARRLRSCFVPPFAEEIAILDGVAP